MYLLIDKGGKSKQYRTLMKERMQKVLRTGTGAHEAYAPS